MRVFIYKAIIITFIFIVGFEFTIGKRIDPIVQSLNKFSNEQGRKELINKLRKEMQKGLNKEYQKFSTHPVYQERYDIINFSNSVTDFLFNINLLI